MLCTSTLASGVNLLAYAVIIKGTQFYDASEGKKVSPEKSPPSTFNTNIIALIQKDELLILINKLSGLLKNFAKILKNIISKKNIEIS